MPFFRSRETSFSSLMKPADGSQAALRISLGVVAGGLPHIDLVTQLSLRAFPFVTAGDDCRPSG